MAEEVDMSLFDEAIEEKENLIQKLTLLDDGFEAMYEKLAKELEGNREKYAGQIRYYSSRSKRSQIWECPYRLRRRETNL